MLKKLLLGTALLPALLLGPLRAGAQTDPKAGKKTPKVIYGPTSKSKAKTTPREPELNTNPNEAPVHHSAFSSRPGLKTQTTTNGLEHHFFKKNNGRKPVVGDILTLHITYKNWKDSTIGSTRQAGPNPVMKRVEPSPFKGSIEEGLLMMSPGDSAVFFIPADSVLKQMPLEKWPPFIHHHTKIAFEVALFDISTEQELKQKENKELFAYAASHNLPKPQVTESGLVYCITQQGTGVQARSGDQVTVHYTGKLLDDKEFDSSVKRGQPFDFALGKRQVIAGWDEGIALLKEGTKAVLLIPARLGYGERGSPPVIPANAPLMFEVELIKTTPPAPPASPATAPPMPPASPEKKK